jgi:hypothetical protein
MGQIRIKKALYSIKKGEDSASLTEIKVYPLSRGGSFRRKRIFFPYASRRGIVRYKKAFRAGKAFGFPARRS